jgi:DNA replicative helicase MCM subunit Mcm2 (Cdc46/Mcm family)
VLARLQGFVTEFEFRCKRCETITYVYEDTPHVFHVDAPRKCPECGFPLIWYREYREI